MKSEKVSTEKRILLVFQRFSLLDTNGDGRASAAEIEVLETNVVEDAVGGILPGDVSSLVTFSVFDVRTLNFKWCFKH